MAAIIMPKWLDTLIHAELEKGSNAKTIAQAIAASPQMLAAIERGMAHITQPGVIGASPAQVIASEIQQALSSKD